MQLANYLASASANNTGETALMSKKMHVQWNDFDKQQMANNTNNKPSNVDEYDVANPDVTSNNKSVNSDLYQAVFPIYHISKLSGVFPTRFVRHVSGRYQGRLSTIDSVYSLCLLACLIGTEIWGFWRDLRHGWENSTRLKSQNAVIVTTSDVLGVMSLTAASIIGSILYWQQVQTVMDKLVDCDEKLGILSPKKLQRYTILLTLCSLSYSIILSCLDIYTWNHEVKLNKKLDDKGPLNYLPLYFMYVVIIMMEVQYAIIVYNVGQRFFRVNKSLENILKSGKITNQFRKDLGLAGDLRDQGQLITYIRQEMVGNTRLFRKSKIIDSTVANDGKSFTDSISQLMTVHASLCDTVSLINTAYGVVVLAITITCLIHLIITPYFLIMEADGRREPLFLAVQGLWCIFHIWRLLIIVQPTYATTMQGKKTAVLVSQLLSANHDREGTKQLEIFSLQLLHRSLEFSACGLFTLDRTLVTSIAGAVTTYLVILIQFQKEDDTKGSFDNILKNATQMLKNATTLHNITVGRLGL
ncbi:gustatory receptor for sugar taste 43a-like isoform X1 [Formica exsecta]|uniref:gustatory receptor for sugar taste 43a-like isoform X1 n=1 Tax=Formica exsecta TaxID=72781 RepID=UPI0011435C9F|nr:gustatory receptor for sugar taste 43a-like isoform X1 [Formica exsecta]